LSYKNAKQILPPDLLEQIQEYIQGEHIYIPQKDNKRIGWGKKSGARQNISFRNKEIIEKHQEGCNIDELCEIFCLSYETIRKIIYSSK
jgi:Mor family transcriptional regulator